jgi:hypothetical protein
MTGALERALRLLMLASALLGASAARADSWLRAESSNFLIYSNVEASATRRYLEQLEAFKYLTERMMGADPSSPTASAKFTIYLLESQDDLKIVRPHLSKYAGGFYSYCVEGAQAYVFRPMSYGIGQPDQGITFVLHEYAHHLMFSRMRRFYPSWYVEGFAEYMSTVTLQRGSYIVGAANPLRVPQLTGEHSWLDYKVMLDPALFSEALKQMMNLGRRQSMRPMERQSSDRASMNMPIKLPRSIFARAIVTLPFVSCSHSQVTHTAP